MSAPPSGSSASGTPSAGYYPDPSIPGYIRYWNGTAWVPGTSRPEPRPGEPMPEPPVGVVAAGAQDAAAATPPAPSETPAPTSGAQPSTGDADGAADTPATPQGSASVPRQGGEVEVRRPGAVTPHQSGEAAAPAGGEPATDSTTAATSWDDPRRLYGLAPGSAPAWRADASRQSGFGGERDQRVTWGAEQRSGDASDATSSATSSSDAASSASSNAASSASSDAASGSSSDATPADATPADATPSGESAAGASEGKPAAAATGGAADGGTGEQGSGQDAAPAGTPPAAHSPRTMAIRLPRPSRGDTPAASDTAQGAADKPAAGASEGKPAAERTSDAAAPSSGASGQATPPSHPDRTVGLRIPRPATGSPASGGPAPGGAPAGGAPASGGPAPGGAPASASPASGGAAPGGAPASASPAPGGAPASGGPAPGGAPAGGPAVGTPAPGPQGGTTPQTPWAQQVHQLAQQAPGDADGASSDAPAPWRPPTTDPFQQAAQRNLRPSGLGKRLVARLIDGLVVFGATGGVAALFVGQAVDHIRDKIEAVEQAGVTRTVWLIDGTTGVHLAIVLAAFLVLGLLYEVLPTARWGRTLGKRLCGLTVVDIERQEVPGFGAALRRWLVYGVLSLLAVGVVNVLWCLFDRPWRQCWHDKAARTFVTADSTELEL